MYLCTDFVQNFCFCQGDALDGSWVSKVIGAGHYAPVQDVAWEHAGRYLVSVSKDQTSRLWYTCTHTYTHTHTHTHTQCGTVSGECVQGSDLAALVYMYTHTHTHTQTGHHGHKGTWQRSAPTRPAIAANSSWGLWRRIRPSGS